MIAQVEEGITGNPRGWTSGSGWERSSLDLLKARRWWHQCYEESGSLLSSGWFTMYPSIHQTT